MISVWVAGVVAALTVTCGVPLFMALAATPEAGEIAVVKVNPELTPVMETSEPAATIAFKEFGEEPIGISATTVNVLVEFFKTFKVKANSAFPEEIVGSEANNVVPSYSLILLISAAAAGVLLEVLVENVTLN